MNMLCDAYPKNRPWDEKVFTMPNIPRGSDGMIVILKKILSMVKNNHKPTDILKIDGSNSNLTLDKACVRLRPMRLVTKNAHGWILTDEAERWLSSSDDLFLAAHLCANIRFLAEVLYYLDTPRKSSELQIIATRDYGMGWQTLSDINSRLVWLRHLGLVEYQDFSGNYLLTELGQSFHTKVTVEEPQTKVTEEDDTQGETSLAIEEWALTHCQLSQQELSTRKQTIGYTPGTTADIRTTISEYLALIQAGTDLGAMQKYAKENYDLAPSSLKSFFTMLTNLGIIERKAENRYALTDTGTRWMATQKSIELICCLHHSFLFIFEMLFELTQKALSIKELTAIAKVSYGFEREARITLFRARNPRKIGHGISAEIVMSITNV